MYSSFRMPVILIGSLLFIIPYAKGFIFGTITVNDFLLRYTIGLLVSAVGVSIVWTLLGGYKRANDYAAKLQMVRIREEEIHRAREQEERRRQEVLHSLEEAQMPDEPTT